MPAGKEWPERARLNPPDAVAAWPESTALSTGILCDGLVAVDVDVDDSAIAAQVVAAAFHHLGSAPSRTRPDSSRSLLLYRAAEGQPSKRSISGPHGKVEALGKGQQFVAFGLHDKGAAYTWPQAGPDGFQRDALTAVSQEALTTFLEVVAPLIGADAPTQAVAPTVALPIELVPSRVTQRDADYAEMALEDEIAKLTALQPGDGRNAALNQSAFVVGTLVGNGSLEPSRVANALLEAASANGHTAKHGETQTQKTIESGLNAGIAKPRSTISSDIAVIDLSVMIANGIAAYKARQSSKPTNGNASGKRSVTLMQGSEIEAKPIHWLWDGYLPSGKLTLLAGAGGTGKSTLAFSIAGTISNAGTWPDGSRCNKAGNVLIWSSEDDPADTIKPRLMAVGANERRYGVISGAIDEDGLSCPFDAARDMDGLREAVRHIGGISLLIIDPIVAAVTGDMHKANDVRRSLQAIVDFAAECDCAVIGITHFAKGTAGKNSAERVIGSQAFAALARMVLVAAKEEDSDRRVFTRAKSNNSIDTGGFSYTIEALNLDKGIITTRVVWREALEGSSRSILSEVEGETDGESRGKTSQAKQYLIKYLTNGPVSSKELISNAKEELGICANTIRKAQNELGIVALKTGFSGGWAWSLPLSSNVPR